MPQHKKPRSLQGIAVEQVAKMAFYSLVAIEAKYDRFEWSASLQKQVVDLQEFLLSKIRPLWEEVCEVLCDTNICRYFECFNHQLRQHYLSLHDFRTLSTFMIHDRMRKLKLISKLCRCFTEPACLSECQIAKLRNIEYIDIKEINVTDKMLEMIGSICKELREIHFVLDSSNASLESLNHLLRCKELQHVDIGNAGWNCVEYELYVLKLLTGLPKLKRFRAYDYWDILPQLTSVSSIEHVDARIRNANQLKNIIEMCPNAQRLHLFINDFETRAEGQRIQTCLAESNCQVKEIVITNFTFDQSMGRLLELKGRNLTELELRGWKNSSITLNDICVIGINCPNLKRFVIHENYSFSESMDPSYGSPVLSPETSIDRTLPMFCNLEHLNVCQLRWRDMHLLLQILVHAKGLKSLDVNIVHFYGLCDEIAEILGVNPMSELESLIFTRDAHVYLVSRISVGSIERLIESCPKLKHLNLSLWLQEATWCRVKQLSEDAQRENYDLSVTFRDTPVWPPW